MISSFLPRKAAQLFEVAFGVALSDVDGQVGHPLRVVGILTQRPGPECTRRAIDHLVHCGLHDGSDSSRDQLG
jgi:hypothetical protein